MNAAAIIPPFDWQRVVVDPWTVHMPGTFWMVLMAMLLASSEMAATDSRGSAARSRRGCRSAASVEQSGFDVG